VSSNENETSGQRPRIPDRLKAVAVVEVIALLIALVEPITPSKTGSTWSPAQIFAADPSYLEKVLASFISVNLLVTILGGLAWVVSKVRGEGDQAS
jgi:hypothetical protein